MPQEVNIYIFFHTQSFLLDAQTILFFQVSRSEAWKEKKWHANNTPLPKPLFYSLNQFITKLLIIIIYLK